MIKEENKLKTVVTVYLWSAGFALKPLVTVVIPAREIGEQLKRCVKSILRSIDRSGQKNIEILVVLNQPSGPVGNLPWSSEEFSS